jgi:hypothetical protein
MEAIRNRSGLAYSAGSFMSVAVNPVLAAFKKAHRANVPCSCRNNPFFARLRSGHLLFQRPSPGKQFPAMRCKNKTI